MNLTDDSHRFHNKVKSMLQWGRKENKKLLKGKRIQKPRFGRQESMRLLKSPQIATDKSSAKVFKGYDRDFATGTFDKWLICSMTEPQFFKTILHLITYCGKTIKPRRERWDRKWRKSFQIKCSAVAFLKGTLWVGLWRRRYQHCIKLEEERVEINF